MSEKLVPVSQIPAKRSSNWEKDFAAIPRGMGKPYEGKRARAAWVAYHKLKKEGKLPTLEGEKPMVLVVRSERIRKSDAVVWVYWEAP